MLAQSFDSNGLPVVEVMHASGLSEIVLVCEHASAEIPEQFDRLGLTTDVTHSHIAWDPGAGETAEQLATMLDAVLVRGKVSRLVYDCNRPPQSRDAIRVESEFGVIPGNVDLTSEQITERVEHYYQPFRETLADTLCRHHSPPVLVTVHSFTPVLEGVERQVEIGILHDVDTRLADAVLAVADGFKISRNEPYGPKDGVTHTLREHGLANGILNVMIEVRNDLLQTPEECKAMAHRLKRWLEGALDQLHASSAEGFRT